VNTSLNELDTPFNNMELVCDCGSDPEVEIVSSTPPRPLSVMPAMIVETPWGDEIVPAEAFDEVTQVIDPKELEKLLGEACAHRHATVREMPAVREDT